MKVIYHLKFRNLLAALGIAAVISGCSGDKPADTQSTTVEPPAPATVEDTPDPAVVDEDQKVIDDFKVKVRACVDSLLDDDTVVSLLYSRYYQSVNGISGGGLGGYGGWYSNYVNYNDLASFWPMGRGAEPIKEDLCQNGLKGSLSALARLSGSGRYNPAEVSNFVGDMGLAVSNQGRLSDIYSNVGSFFAQSLGSGNWGIGVGSGSGFKFFKTHVNASTQGFLEKVRGRLTDRGAISNDATVVTAGLIPATLPRGISRQLRGLMAAQREDNGTTAQIHQRAQKALSSRHLLK